MAGGDNGHGMTGMVWKNIGIIGCNAINKDDSNDAGIDKIMKCLDFCNKAGAKITQNSYAIFDTPFSSALYEKFKFFGKVGLSIMAAGNRNENIPASFYGTFPPKKPNNLPWPIQPSSYGPFLSADSAGSMINVGACGYCTVKDGLKSFIVAPYSGYGRPYVDILATGGGPEFPYYCDAMIGPASKDSVMTKQAVIDKELITGDGTNNDGWKTSLYIPVFGTSFASPLVAGTVAMIWARRPALSNLQVKKIVLSTATSSPFYPLRYENEPGTGAGVADASTYGLLNVYKALQCTEPQNFGQSNCTV